MGGSMGESTDFFVFDWNEAFWRTGSLSLYIYFICVNIFALFYSSNPEARLGNLASLEKKGTKPDKVPLIRGIEGVKQDIKT